MKSFLWMWLLLGSQWAMADAARPAQPGITSFLPLILIFGIFYFLIIRPQQKKTKLHQKFLTEMKRGDMIVTSFGMIGTIKTLSDKFVTLEIDDGVCVKVLRGQIAESAATLKDEKAKTTPLMQPQEEKK